jgi:hypothetical protein
MKPLDAEVLLIVIKKVSDCRTWLVHSAPFTSAGAFSCATARDDVVTFLGTLWFRASVAQALGSKI